MAELYPIALGPILHRALQELDSKDAIFALPRRKWWQGTPDLDLSVDFLGRPAANAVGPAAGPQSQLIQSHNLTASLQNALTGLLCHVQSGDLETYLIFKTRVFYE